jgi:hypothetical protein
MQGEDRGAVLDGVDQGPATTFAHPRGWFRFELPQGWSVTRQADDSLTINPGLTPSDTLDALVVVSYGQLEADQAGRDLAALFAAAKATILEELASQAIVAGDAVEVPRRVVLAHAPGIVQELKGKAGERDVSVWLGGLVEDGYYLTVTAVVLAGKEVRFLPGARRILHSVQPRPPERNRPAEQALVGARFGAIETRPGGSRGSFSTIFEFGENQRVKKTMIVSGIVGLSADVGGESEEWGTYEAVGDEVHLSFPSGRDALELVIENGEIAALRRGDRVYRRR